MSYSVAVRALCEFTAKAGDLDLRFTPSPSASEGIAGHALVTSRRSDIYQREISLSGTYRELVVRGRADGYDPERNRLEEIKTYRGDLATMPSNHRVLHWAQAKIYGYLLCCERQLDNVELALVYFDIGRQKETVLCETHSREALRDFFQIHCERFLQWAQKEVAHRESRDRALESLQFPFASFRSGQRELSETVYKAAALGRCLLAEAPAGTGKTLGTLFPLLKAMPRQALDKVFYLAAKTPGRQLALEAMSTVEAKPVRTLELIAREKSCEYPDKSCNGDSCPLAQGFYDRLPAAREAAANETLLTQPRLRQIGLEHNICPYYLAQEMARWCDVVVGDYNYYFDLSAILFALTQSNSWRVALLVDESHNLMDRARAMYTAELNQVQFRAVKKAASKHLQSAFNKVNRVWNALNKHSDADYSVQDGIPEQLVFALQSATAAVADYAIDQPEGLDKDLLQWYFDALHFLRVAELYESDTFLFDISWQKPRRGRRGSLLCLRNLIPARMLQQRFQSTHTTTLFSATLRPARYYRDVLGLPSDTVFKQVASPFLAEQLQVHVKREISTRFYQRGASVRPIAELIVHQYRQKPGNYLAFFSSYDYLNQVVSYLHTVEPALPVWVQSRHMDELARNDFLEKFKAGGEGVGFAVLGGAFSEGIDLPGTRLIGAFVATLGLPQTNPVNEQLCRRTQALFGDGYNYTYLYPGLRKVVQAAGRVIRTEEDRGVVWLIDDRFDQPRVQALLPEWWQLAQTPTVTST